MFKKKTSQLVSIITIANFFLFFTTMETVKQYIFQSLIAVNATQYCGKICHQNILQSKFSLKKQLEIL